jgi:hypothetical protein
VSLDPAIWRRRAELTIEHATFDAIDAGFALDAVELRVRFKTPCPFGDDPTTAASRFYAAMLDAAFAPRRRRRPR